MSSPNSSDRKILANRQNASQSTGPKTPEGKTRSSQNARKFGIFCKDLLVPGESKADLDALKRDMVRGLNPRTEPELQLVEQIVADEWRIKRIRAAERSAYERLHADDCQRVRNSNGQRRSDAVEELRAYEKRFATELRENRAPKHVVEIMSDAKDRLAQIDRATSPAPDPGMAMTRLLENSPGLERLWKHEQRLRNSVHRCMKELRQIRKEGADDLSELAAGMLDEEPETEEANVKNEATADASDGGEGGCESKAVIESGNVPQSNEASGQKSSGARSSTTAPPQRTAA